MSQPKILQSLIDKKVLGFKEWKQSLDNEDVEEVGSIVPRCHKDLSQLYETYLKFQSSQEFNEARKYYYEPT